MIKSLPVERSVQTFQAEMRLFFVVCFLPALKVLHSLKISDKNILMHSSCTKLSLTDILSLYCPVLFVCDPEMSIPVNFNSILISMTTDVT